MITKVDTQKETVVIGSFLTHPNDTSILAKEMKKWVDKQLENGCTHFTLHLSEYKGSYFPGGIWANRTWNKREKIEDKIKKLEAEIAQLKEELKNA